MYEDKCTRNFTHQYSIHVISRGYRPKGSHIADNRMGDITLSIAMSRNHASWRWMASMAATFVLTVVFALSVASGATAPRDLFGSSAASPSAAASTAPSTLDRLAADHPGRGVEVIAQLAPGTDPAAARELVRSLGGSTIAELPIIEGLAVELTAGATADLRNSPLVEAVSLNAEVKGQGKAKSVEKLASAYNSSIRSPKAWKDGITGDGVGVAVIDTGIAGDLPDFQTSQSDKTSRVVASAVINPDAANAGDGFGHGTHIAGLIAGNGLNRPNGDLRGKYIGVAPDADLISVKAADEDGNSSVLDVIEGLQFVVDHKSDYNIRVVNLSLRSTEAESYKTDPLDAAVEAAWNSGIVVVAAAGNDGAAADAVSYAPANDPYVITVGGVDDAGTKSVEDDRLASWSSRGTTQDGFAKPDLLAPGSRLISTMAPGADYLGLCPTCVVDGDYFRVGGTSMAAGVVSGQVALMLEANPSLTPNQVKAQITKRTRPVLEPAAGGDLVDASGAEVDGDLEATIVGGEAAVDKAIFKPQTPKVANAGLAPNTLLDPATGGIDYSRASWSRASWSQVAGTDPLRASWSRASWSRASWSRASWSATEQSCTDFERASWSRASWSSADLDSAFAECEALLDATYPTRASWSASEWSCTGFERASWSRASWSRASWSAEGIASAQDSCSALLAEMYPTRASWSANAWTCSEFERASWSRASWSRASWSDAELASGKAACEQLLAQVDSTRASWSRASWSRASWSRASWSRASWSRASWSRASWSRASWSTSFTK